MRWQNVNRATPDHLARIQIEVDMDVPVAGQLDARSELVDFVVRLAETLRRGDDTYHLVYREHNQAEALLLPLGPQIQVLGERLALALGRAALERRTVLWIVLAANVPLAEVVDPALYDPDREGEPARLLRDRRIRWAVAMSYAHRGPSTLYRSLLHVPPSASSTTEQLLARLRDRLIAG
jgi:hypothetical protein